MTTAPKISVVVPCYNGGKFFDQLTASLARQTFRDFEVIIVDDGSPDPATQAKLAALDPAIRVIRHPQNRRMSAARNTGFSAARADVIMALDCDDQLEPTYLEECFAALQSAPPDVGFVFTHVRLTGANHGTERRYFNAFDVLFKNTIGYSILVHKSAWLKAGKYDESMVDGYEDWEFTIRLIHAGYRGIEIAKPLFIYNVSMNGMMMSHSSRLHAALWRKIRAKNPELYRISSLIRLFRESQLLHEEKSSLLRTIGSLMLTSVLPDAWFSAVIHLARSRRLARENMQAAPIERGPVVRADSRAVG
jgi:glycosyltransferase involved in cell wall biosynthesis